MAVKGVVIMQIGDYIEIVAILVTVIISSIGGVYVVITNTKKYELSEQYKRELLGWYEKVICIIAELLQIYDTGKAENKSYLLSQLSAMIEVGRFYFPNVKKGDGFGENKPEAYKGYRHLALDFLVYIYDTMKRDDNFSHKDEIKEFERQFTSIIFECIDPNKRKKQLKRYADYTMPKDMPIDDLVKLKTEEAVSFRKKIYRRKSK